MQYSLLHYSYFHIYVINILGASGRNLLTRRMHTSIFHLKLPRSWVDMIIFEKLMKNLILSIPYTFVLSLRSFYGTSKLDILVINTSKTHTNILMQSQSSATLLKNYLINAPLASKLRCPKIQFSMRPLVLSHSHIKVSFFFDFSGITSD